jgi:hypothetical protein
MGGVEDMESPFGWLQRQGQLRALFCVAAIVLADKMSDAPDILSKTRHADKTLYVVE